MIHIIDDEPCILEILTEVIKSFGYPTETFSCPSLYCEYAHSRDYKLPNIIITDVRMPKINGYQLMDQVSEVHKKIKFIVMTGHQEPDDKRSEHPHIFIRKPFNPEQLHMHIQQLTAET